VITPTLENTLSRSDTITIGVTRREAAFSAAKDPELLGDCRVSEKEGKKPKILHLREQPGLFKIDPMLTRQTG
jgi:hypothetical protein